MYKFMPSAPGSTNYNTQFKNMKTDIFKRSKFNALFDYSSNKSQEFFSIFGNEDMIPIMKVKDIVAIALREKYLKTCKTLKKNMIEQSKL